MTDIVHGLDAMRPREPVLSRWVRTIDRGVLLAIIALFLIGLLLCFAASLPLAERLDREPFAFVLRHAVFGTVAILTMILISTLTRNSARRIGIAVFLLSFVGILLLPFFGTDFGKGAVRWFSFGFGSVQPSEFLKPGFVVVASWLIAGSMQAAGPPGKILSLGLTVIIVMLLALQPDFGQACLFIFAWCILFFISGAAIWPLVVVSGATVAGGMLAYNVSEHFRRRIVAYVSDDIGTNSQLETSIAAYREGGFFGVGVASGRVKESLPDAHTDFIVAVAAEEYGLGLVMVIIGLFTFVCIRSIRRMQTVRDPFIRLACTGLAALIGIQAFIHISVSVGLLPAKGLTLPLISYGGSSMIATGITLGMLLAFSRSETGKAEAGPAERSGIPAANRK